MLARLPALEKARAYTREQWARAIQEHLDEGVRT